MADDVVFQATICISLAAKWARLKKSAGLLRASVSQDSQLLVGELCIV
jgi:hypothetical protein